MEIVLQSMEMKTFFNTSQSLLEIEMVLLSKLELIENGDGSFI